jgi:hypothetical protein
MTLSVAARLAAFVAVLAAPAYAGRVTASQWTLDGEQKVKIKSLGTQVETVDGATLTVNGDDTASLSFPGHESFYSGAVTDVGKRNFVFTPDESALAAWEEFVHDRVLDDLGAEDVQILSSSLVVKGSAVLDEEGIATELVVKLKAKARASVTLSGRTRKGSGSIKGLFTAFPAP